MFGHLRAAVSEFLAVLRDLWTSTGALPRDLALAVADDAPQEDASAFFTKAGIFTAALWEAVPECSLRFSQLPHRDARPDSQMPAKFLETAQIAAGRPRCCHLVRHVRAACHWASKSRSVHTSPILESPGVLGEPAAGEANDCRAGSALVADPVIGGPVGLANGGNFDRLTVR